MSLIAVHVVYSTIDDLYTIVCCSMWQIKRLLQTHAGNTFRLKEKLFAVCKQTEHNSHIIIRQVQVAALETPIVLLCVYLYCKCESVSPTLP